MENHVALCPQCNAIQNGGPKVNAETEPGPRHWLARRLLAGLSELTGLAPSFVIILLAAPLAVAGAFGYLIASQTGAVIGVVVAVALLIGIVVWAESGG